MHAWCAFRVVGRVEHCVGARGEKNKRANDACYMSNLLTHLKTLRGWKSFRRSKLFLTSTHPSIGLPVIPLHTHEDTQAKVYPSLRGNCWFDFLCCWISFVRISWSRCFMSSRDAGPEQTLYFGPFISVVIVTRIGLDVQARTADKGNKSVYSELVFARDWTLARAHSVVFGFQFSALLFTNVWATTRTSSGLSRNLRFDLLEAEGKRRNKLNFHNLSSQSAAASKPFSSFLPLHRPAHTTSFH